MVELLVLMTTVMGAVLATVMAENLGRCRRRLWTNSFTTNCFPSGVFSHVSRFRLLAGCAFNLVPFN